MEKISGLILDPYDDVGGSVMKAMYPTLESVPDFVKTAAPLSPEQREQLPDDAFALVLHQDGTVLRKYACIDGGNTALNIAYFLSTYNKLPMEAVKTAAANLCTACHWYDIEPPEELKKLSTGNIPVIGKQQVWKELDGTTYSNNPQSWELEKNAGCGGKKQKIADVTDTYDMPAHGLRAEDKDPSKTRLSAVKTAEEHFVDSMMGAEAPNAEDAGETLDVGEGLPEQDQPAALPQTKQMKPHVDVSGKEPPKLIEKKSHSRYAMPSIGKYPLDGIDHLEKAAEYFDTWYKEMDPPDRREFAVNLVKRANELHKPLSKVAHAYGGQGYAPEHELVAAIDQRVLLLAPHAEQDPDVRVKEASVHVIGLYRELFDKRAMVTPDVYAGTLHEIDKLASLEEHYDQELEDPWVCTFKKLAEEHNPKDAIVIGNDYMKLDDLETFARIRSDAIESAFGPEFVTEFQADPKGIFDSLPVDQKKVIMRMVGTELSLQGASTG